MRIKSGGVRETTHVRIYRTMADELKVKFPGVRMPDLMQICYSNSILKLEAKLRKR